MSSFSPGEWYIRFNTAETAADIESVHHNFIDAFVPHIEPDRLNCQSQLEFDYRQFDPSQSTEITVTLTSDVEPGDSVTPADDPIHLFSQTGYMQTVTFDAMVDSSPGPTELSATLSPSAGRMTEAMVRLDLETYLRPSSTNHASALSVYIPNSDKQQD
jgi:hypothetical protein